MQINKIELAKTISDFLFLNIEKPEEKAIKLFEFKHLLDKRGHGFEKYIQYYFRKFKGYKVELNGKTNQFDKGIDLKGIKKVNGKLKYLVVQCKNYSIKDITENDVRYFYGAIAENLIVNKDKTDVYYITTTKFTKNAKDFLVEKGIKAIDFELISKLQELYSIEDFKQDLFIKEGQKEVDKSFSKEQLIINLDENILNTIEATDTEVFQLLKQVRRDFSYSKQLRLGDIARNDTLEILAKKRPHNLKALKEITKTFSIREKNKIDKYGEVFIERLKYLSIQDFDKKSIKNDSFLNKLFSLF